MLSLRQKLVLSYFLLVAITIAVGVYSIRSTRRVEHAIGAIIATDSRDAMIRGQL